MSSVAEPRTGNQKFITWGVVAVLIIVQALFTFNSMKQIRYEELAESVRNPFWFQNRLMYDGFSGSMAWYGSLAFLYNIFGFHIFTAKFVRLFLHAISMVCLAVLLKKYLGYKWVAPAILAYGLSPTMLYFNTLQSTYGIDLQFAPILLLVLSALDFKKGHRAFALQLLFGFLSMAAWLSYPTFLFYIPALAVLYGCILQRAKMASKKFSVGRNVLMVAGAFLLPLLAIFLYTSNRWLLVYDPDYKSGLFRGAGVFQFDVSLLWRNLSFLTGVTFDKAAGYYHEVAQVEFSMVFPVLGVLSVIYLVFRLWNHDKKIRFVISIAVLIMLFNLIFISFTVDHAPGIRRYTPTLFSFYALFALAVYYLQLSTGKALKFLGIILLLYIPLHHIFVLPQNLSKISERSRFVDIQFSSEGDPPGFVKGLVEQVQKQDLNLVCKGQNSQFIECRYNEIYSAVAGSCYWNRLQCHRILGFDHHTNQMIPLSTKLWETYYFGH